MIFWGLIGISFFDPRCFSNLNFKFWGLPLIWRNDIIDTIVTSPLTMCFEVYGKSPNFLFETSDQQTFRASLPDLGLTSNWYKPLRYEGNPIQWRGYSNKSPQGCVTSALGYRFMDLHDGLNKYGSGLSMQLTLNYLVNSNLQHLTLWPWKQFLMIHPHFRSKKEVKKWLLYDWWQIWSQNVTAKQKLAEKKTVPLRWEGSQRKHFSVEKSTQKTHIER